MEDNFSDDINENPSSQLVDSERIVSYGPNRAEIHESSSSFVTSGEKIYESDVFMTVSTKPASHVTCDDHHQHGKYIFRDFFKEYSNSFSLLLFYSHIDTLNNNATDVENGIQTDATNNTILRDPKYTHHPPAMPPSDSREMSRNSV